MPITENPAFSLIQQEINDCAQREKEYQLMRNNLESNNNNNNNNNNNVNNNNNNNDININGNGNHMKNGDDHHDENDITTEPVLIKEETQEPINKPTNGYRKIIQNPGVRGIMHQFIKSRGKLTQNNKMEKTFKAQHRWSIPDVVDSTTRILNTGTEPVIRQRKGYVPVEERMKKEFMDLRNREIELMNVRKQSDTEYSSLDDYELKEPKHNLRKFKSMMQLRDCNNDDEYVENDPMPSPTLKPARSLAELCAVNQDDLITTPSSLILKWENIIKENQERN